MHLKAAEVDHGRLLFGSCNWTYWGQTLHHEGMLHLEGKALVHQMLDQFEQDWYSA